MEKGSTWKIINLFLVFLFVGLVIISLNLPGNNLKVIACDVGQGDASLLIYKNTQIIIDGGPNSSVLECLERHIPFWDREIELVVLTHPESDHLTGLIDVFEGYNIGLFVHPGINPGSPKWEVLENLVGGRGINTTEAKEGQVVRLGLIQLDILHPSNDFLSLNSEESDKKVLGAHTTNKNLNIFSVVLVASYKDADFLFPGDIDPTISDQIAVKLQDKGIKNVEYIKIPHHGSKNGLTENLLNVLNSKIAVIEVGKNSYGHPHEEILNMLKEKGIITKRTDQEGDVVIETDGESLWVVKK